MTIRTCHTIACTLAVMLAMSSAAGADHTETHTESEQLIEEVVVTADRIPAFSDPRVDEREGAQIIAREYVRAQLATTLADALRKTTSVQVDEEAGYQGSIISIRGMQGDAVSVRIDGAPQNFNQVRHGGANTIWAEPDIYKSITVIPGVASNIYGSGSIGGVIKLETIDPGDLLQEDDRWALGARVGHETNGDALVRSMEAAHRFTDSVAGLIHVLARNNGAYEDGSGIETLGGATGSEDRNALVKLNIEPHEAHALELAYRFMEKDYTARGTQSRGREVSSTDQFTKLNERSMSAQYVFQPVGSNWIDANMRLSRIDVERDRRSAGTADWSTWASTTDYLEIENTSNLNIGGNNTHRLRYGLDLSSDDLLTAYFDANGGQLARTRDIRGIYLSNAFDWGRLSVVASVRHDDYRTEDLSSGAQTQNSRISQKLHLAVQPFTSGKLRNLSVFALFGSGFRAPSVHETFGRGETGVTCSRGRRGFACSERVPNADLEAETNDSREAGLRFAGEGVFVAGDQLFFSVAYIESDVTDFIDTQQLASGETVVNSRRYPVLRSTFTNINAAEISGWEYSANYSNSRWFAALASQTMDGRNTTTGLNLRDVSPHSTNFSVGAYLAAGKLRVGLDITNRSGREIDEDPAFNRLPYTVYDLFASWRFNDRYHVQLRLENATNELYTKRFQSLSLDTQTGEQQDYTYYQPGRNLKFSFEARLF